MKKTYLSILTALVLSTGLSAQNLSLDSCKHYALENNKKIKESQLELKASELVKKDAFTKYFPKVEAGAIAMKAKNGLIEGSIPEMTLPVFDYTNAVQPMPTPYGTYFPGMEIEALDYTNTAFIMAVQPIYTGGRIINGNKLAKLGIDVRELMIDMTTDEVIQNTENYYWTIVSLQEKVKTLDSYEKLLKNLLADVTVSHEAGLVQKSDLLKVKMELNKIKANRLKLNNGISILKMTLAQQMGADYGENYTLNDTTITIIDPVALYANPDEALINRVEYKLLNKSLTAEQLQKKMARGEFMPQVAVGAQAFYLDMMENETSNALGFAMVTIPISDWWGGSHKIKEHQIKIEIAENKLAENSELLKLQMNKSYNDLNECYLQIKVAELSQEQAQELLTEEQNNYEAGVVSTSDMLEAQAVLQQAKDIVVDAKTAYKIKQAVYLQTISQLK